MVLTCHQSHNWELEQYHICPQYILNFLTFALDISFVTFLKDKYRHKSLHVCLTLVVAKDGPNISIFCWPKYFKTNISNFVPIISKQSLFSYSNICTNMSNVGPIISKQCQNICFIFLYIDIFVYMFYIVFINIFGRLNYFKTILWKIFSNIGPKLHPSCFWR